MTKTKRNFIFIASLLFIVMALCSVFIIVQTKPRTVEAGTLSETELQQRRNNPGLYQTNSTTLVTSWDNLISGRKITTSNGSLRVKDTTLAGDLVCGSVDGLTSLASAFDSCSKLTIIDLTNLDTSNVKNMYNMFYDCSLVTSLDLSNFNTKNVTDMGAMFENCLALTSLDLSNINTSKVTNMSYMFSGCLKLTTLNIRNLDTKNVTNIRYMFSNCTSLTSLDASSFDTSNVTNMMSLFEGCSKLTTLNISNFNTSNVTNMSYMFNGCSKLTSIDVSNFDTSNVIDMTDMFYGCTSLKSLDVSGFNTSKVMVFTAMFGGTKLTVLDMSNFDFSSARSTSLMGMLGINDTYCLGVLQQKASSYVPVYQSAMKNEDISVALGTISRDLASMYSSAIAGKTGDEVGYTGRVYIVGILINQMYYSSNATQMEASLNDAQVLFETKIGTIYAPAKASSKQISLPYGTNYVGSSNGTKTALPAQILYGYEDISSGTPLTELAIFEGTLDTPAPKPSEVVPSTGVQANIAMVVVALSSILGLVVVATKRKRVKKF